MVNLVTVRIYLKSVAFSNWLIAQTGIHYHNQRFICTLCICSFAKIYIAVIVGKTDESDDTTTTVSLCKIEFGYNLACCLKSNTINTSVLVRLTRRNEVRKSSGQSSASVQSAIESRRARERGQRADKAHAVEWTVSTDKLTRLTLWLGEATACGSLTSPKSAAVITVEFVVAMMVQP